jgi:two-component system sensor histidine kinase and response regulator WspE
MSDASNRDLSAFSLLDLFRSEASSQNQVLGEGLLALERDANDLSRIDELMRAAHSIKGAAAIVNLPLVVILAHKMEDVFVAAQNGTVTLHRRAVDLLLAGVDLLEQIAQLSDDAAPAWFADQEKTMMQTAEAIGTILDPTKATNLEPSEPAIIELLSLPADDFSTDLNVEAGVRAGMDTVSSQPQSINSSTNNLLGQATTALLSTDSSVVPTATPTVTEAPAKTLATSTGNKGRGEQSLKVDVVHLERLLSLTSQAVVSAHLLAPLLQSMQREKKKQSELFRLLGELQDQIEIGTHSLALKGKMYAVMQLGASLKQDFSNRLVELETHHRTSIATSQSTLDGVLAIRMRPIKDGLLALPRMVRDLSHSLGKEVRLEISGENTLVDREILTKIESPINQIRDYSASGRLNRVSSEGAS